MNANIPKSRRVVITVIINCLIMLMLADYMRNVIVGYDKLPQQSLKCLLHLVFCIFLYRGANWARLVMGALYGLGGIYILWLSVFRNAVIPMVGNAVFIIGLGNVACAGILLFATSLKQYCGRNISAS